MEKNPEINKRACLFIRDLRVPFENVCGFRIENENHYCFLPPTLIDLIMVSIMLQDLFDLKPEFVLCPILCDSILPRLGID